MNSLAHPRVARRRSRRVVPRAAVLPRGLVSGLARPGSWRGIGLLACWIAVSAAGWAINVSLDFPAVRAHVALACGALASAVVLAERWEADSKGMERGCVLSILAGAASACASLIQA